jgi:hypothetical protein
MRLDAVRIPVIAVMSVAALVTGFGQGALGTEAGRRIVVAAVLEQANRSLRGTVAVRSTEGSLVQGLVAHDVTVTGHDGRPLAAIGRLAVRYHLTDFLSGRIVLGEIEVDSVRVDLEQRPGERFNYQEVLRLGEGPPGGHPPLVAFRNARVLNLDVRIRTPGPDDSAPLVERDLRVTEAVLPYVRISSPIPGDRGIRLEFAALEAALTAPRLTVTGATGSLEVVGDTIAVDFRTVRLPGTHSSMRGRFFSPGHDLRVDLAFRARAFSSDDLRALFDWMPAGASGAGAVDVRSDPGDVLVVRARDLDLRFADGGTARGTFGMDIGPGEAWTVHAVDAETRDFVLVNLEGVLDTVPFEGRLTGRTRADGPSDGVRVDLDWLFHDRRADSAATLLRGAGVVAFGVPGDIVFRELLLDTARLALATVRAISPGVALRGDIEGRGVLDGPWQDATFRGTFLHRLEDLPVSRAEGWVRLDTRRDTVAASGDLTMDSLQWDAIRPDYPTVPFVGGMAGRITFGGAFDALRLDGMLAGPHGSVEGGGAFIIMTPHLGVRDLDARFADLELVPLRERLPETALTGRLRGGYERDTLRAPEADLELELERSLIGGSRVDGGFAALAIHDSVVTVESGRLALLGALFTGGGRLPIAGAGTDSLVLALHAEAVAVLQPLADRLPFLGAIVGDTLGGAADGRVVVRGSLTEPEVSWTVAAPEIRLDGTRIAEAASTGRWALAAPGMLDLEVTIAEVARGGRSFTDLRANAAGTLEALRWRVAGSLGAASGVRAGGWLRRDDSLLVGVDSLALRTAADEWRLDPGAGVRVTAAAARFDGVRLATADGRGVVTVEGSLPRGAPDSLEVRGEGIPLTDLWALLQFDPRSASGELSGTLSLRGTAGEPDIALSFQMRNAVFNEYRTPLVEATVGYRGRRVTGQLSTYRIGDRIVDVSVDLPMDLSLRSTPRRRLPGPLSVRARASDVDLALLSAVSPLIRQTEGRLTADFGIAGTWDEPRLDGTLDIREGAATLTALGVRHRAVHAAIRLAGREIQVDSLSAQSGDGAASAVGTVRLEGLSRPVLDLRIRARDFRALDIPDFLTLVASGEVTLQGPVFGAVLTGAGTIPRGTVYFADIIQKNVVDLTDTLLALDTATARALRAGHLGPDFQNRFLDSVRIRDLALTMGSDVRLRSTEADIFLEGRVLVQKEADRYRLDGTLRTPRGTYQLTVGPTIRKPFTVTRGEVRYFGTTDLNAALDIEARHQLRGQRGENVAVLVHVGGTLLAPRLTLTSDVEPPLTNEEILSYLVIGAPNVQSGRGVGRYGVEESISTLAAQVSGQLSSQLMGDLGVPLDYLEIRPQFGVSGVEATEVAVGRQISDRWFVKLNPRFCSKQAFTAQNLGGSLEFRMSREWSILASADPVEVCTVTAAGVGRLQLGFDLLWEKRF